MTVQKLNSEGRRSIASEKLTPTDIAGPRMGSDIGSSAIRSAQAPADDVLTLEGLEPGGEEGIRFEITWKDWLDVARIVAVSKRVDVEAVSRMFDPQPGDEFERKVAEDLDTAVLLLLEWMDRIRAERIYLSARSVRIQDEHHHLDPGTYFVDLQTGWDDPGIEFETLYRFRHFVVESNGFRILQPVPRPVSSSETPERPEDSGACSDRNLERPGLDFGDDDDEFSFEDDEEDTCSCPNNIDAKAVVADQAPRSKGRTLDDGCRYCGIVGCSACTYEEMYALDLVAGFCSFAAKEAEDLDVAMGLVRSLCDELVLEETEEGWVEWRGATDHKIATIATCAIRDDTFLLSNLSAYLAEPDDSRISLYREAERGALERVRAGYPDELRPADVTVFW